MPPRKPKADPGTQFRDDPEPERLPPEPEIAPESWQPSPQPSQFTYDAPFAQPPPFLGDAPPMVATVPKDAVQFIVKVDDNGRQQELGRISTRATHEHLIDRFYDALYQGGTVYLFPIDMTNRLLCHPNEPFTVDISLHHEAIRRVAAKRQHAVGGVGQPLPPAGLDVQALLANQAKIFQDQLDRIREDNARRDTEIKEREIRLARQEEKLAEQKLAMAVTTADTQNSFTEKVHDATVKGHESAVGMMNSMFQNSIAQQNAFFAAQATATAASAQAERERIQASNDAALARIDAERASERERADAREKEEVRRRVDRLKEEEQFRRDREDWQNKAHERELAAQRDHGSQTLKLIEATRDASDPMKMMSTLAITVTPLLKAVGVDPKDLGELFKGAIGGGSKGGWLAAVTSVAEKLADTAVEMKKLDMEAAGDEDNELVVVQSPQGPVQITKGQLKAFQAQAQAQQQPQQLPAPPPVVNNNADLALPPWPAGTPGVPADRTAGGQSMPAPSAPTPGDNLPPQVQRAGRKAARAIVEGLASASDKVSTGLVLLNEHKAALEPYVRVVGVRFALNEGGASEALIAEIMPLIMPVLPQGIPL